MSFFLAAFHSIHSHQSDWIWLVTYDGPSSRPSVCMVCLSWAITSNSMSIYANELLYRGFVSHEMPEYDCYAVIVDKSTSISFGLYCHTQFRCKSVSLELLYDCWCPSSVALKKLISIEIAYGNIIQMKWKSIDHLHLLASNCLW